MKRTISLLLVLFLASCSATAPYDYERRKGGDEGPDEPNGAEEPADEYDPGVHVFLEMASVSMMGRPSELAVAGFMPAAREDFESAEEDLLPLGTCLVLDAVEPPSPECMTDADCYPEQECQPRYDGRGRPIPDSERCVTPRELMDVGPFTMTGFNSGPLTFEYNPGQDGAYTTMEPGDGRLPSGEMDYETTYVFEGEGDISKGIGHFHGELMVGSNLQLMEPPTVEILGLLPAIEVDPNRPLHLMWAGDDPEEQLNISLSGGSFSAEGATIECRVSNNGSFIIPQAMVEAAGLGDLAIFNMLTLETSKRGWVEGEGIEFHDVKMRQTFSINVSKTGD